MVTNVVVLFFNTTDKKKVDFKRFSTFVTILQIDKFCFFIFYYSAKKTITDNNTFCIVFLYKMYCYFIQ